MHPPAYWWLLAVAVVLQVLSLAGMFILRAGRKAIQIPLWVRWCRMFGALAGLAYGFVQSDMVFMLGQVLFFILVVRATRDNT